MSLKFKYFFANLIVMYLVLGFYLCNKYYIEFLRPETRFFLCAYAIIYTIVGFLYYCFVNAQTPSETKGYMALKTIKNLFSNAITYLTKFTTEPAFQMPPMTFAEKTNLLFLLVKIYFLPIVVNFVLDNFSLIMSGYISWTIDYHRGLSIEAFNKSLYHLLLSILILVDCTVFVVGYAADAKILRNQIRSVEPTMFGWLVTLICYPPFNIIPNFYVSCYATDFAVFHSDIPTFWARLTALILFAIYVWASIALGMKASNLTNRGIVTSGPYAFVRHPAYIAKNLAWWVSIFAINTVSAYIGMVFFSFIYFLRAITEERHLIQDPGYQAYCKVVKYRFIPKLF